MPVISVCTVSIPMMMQTLQWQQTQSGGDQVETCPGESSMTQQDVTVNYERAHF